MKEFTKDIAELSQFLSDNPTLTHQRRALGTNGRLADVEFVDDWIGEQFWKAGYSFLNRLHEENFLSLPQAERDKIITELNELKEPVIIVDADGKPELTADYLRSIGKESYIEWGTDRA